MIQKKIPSSTAYALFDTAVGSCAIAWNERGIVRVALPEPTPVATHARMTAALPDAQISPPPKAIARAIAKIVAHLNGGKADLSAIVLETSGLPPFHQRVYDVARQIPSGTTLTYGEIARLAGSPDASRAVGQALRKNPFPVIVPCHRVLASGQKAGGFTAPGGVETKKKLLAIEGVTLEPRAARSSTRGPLDVDPAHALAHLRERDAKLGALIAEVGPFALKTNELYATFVALAESIVYQQLTGKAAATIFARVKAACDPLEPERVLATPVEALRAAGLSGSKVVALKDLATKTLEGAVPDVETLRAMDDETIVSRLTAVRGIGRWSVEMLLIFRLGRLDVLPIGDYGVRKGFAQIYGKKELPTPKEVAKYGERWRPFRTVASWYLWRALDRPKTATTLKKARGGRG